MKKYLQFLTICAVLIFTVGNVGAQQDARKAAYPYTEKSMPTDVTAVKSAKSISTSLQAAPASVMDDVDNALVAGADRLVSLQNNDGGWDWPLDDGDPNNTSPRNTIGPIAMGLAQAYLFTNDAAYLSALSNAGSLLLSKINNFSPSDGYLANMLDQVFGVTTYSGHVIANFYGPLAAGTYDRNGASTLYSTQSYIQLIHNARHGGGIGNLAAWDIGMGLVGAASCGVTGTELDYWVNGVKNEIDLLDGDDYYDVIGLAGAIYGLAFVGEDFDPTTGEHAAASNINDLADILASYQINLGGFAWNSDYVIPDDYNETIQETAYSLLALYEVDKKNYSLNVHGAANYMISAQLNTGGWENYVGSLSGENNEITGEAMWGIAIIEKYPVHNVTQDTWYCTIQAAVDAAADGDKIEVKKGKHFGAIVDKPVELKGKKGAVIIDGPWYRPNLPLRFGFLLLSGASGTKIKGFTFEGNGTTDKIAFPIFARSADNITVEKNTLKMSLQGITNWHGSGWKIKKNKLDGLWIYGGGGIGIFIGCSDGLSSANNNKVEDNKIKAHFETPPPDYSVSGLTLYSDHRYGRAGGLITDNVIKKNKVEVTGTPNTNACELTDQSDLVNEVTDNKFEKNDLKKSTVPWEFNPVDAMHNNLFKKNKPQPAGLLAKLSNTPLAPKPFGSEEGEGFPIELADVESSIPETYALYQNYPNPFNPTTLIQFSIPEAGNYKINVYSILGDKVAELVNANYSPGVYNVQFNASNLPSGIYVYQLLGGSVNITNKMILMK
ncbi:MAG: T9SS type A sorting domain-containing protein [Melioribacteraceae bacterium]|nr:T9SS type A sorting domain-containing protein [Melioribacteraceae bacterium]